MWALRERGRSFLLTIAIAVAFAAPVKAEDACPPTDAKVEAAEKIAPVYEGQRPSDAVAPYEMGETIELSGPGLGTLATCGGTGKPVVLFLGSLPLSGLQPEAIGPTSLRFKLVRGEASKKAWTEILGRPASATRLLSVSVGYETGEPVPSAVRIGFVALPKIPFAFGIIQFLALLLIFGLLAKHTTILREGGIDPAGPIGQYSLSKTQAAWWFFVVLGAYLLIWLVTGDYTTSINGTALSLLAIGGGTAIGSAAIGSSVNNAPEEIARRTAAAAAAQAKVATAKTMTGPKKAVAMTAATTTEKIIKRQSLGFFYDILSDADGISFHRFQSLAWNLTLTVVFGVGVYKELAMPDFDPTLLGLLGISSATYLGLKTTEATIPRSVAPTGSP